MRAFIYARPPVTYAMVSKYRLAVSIIFLGLLAFLLTKLDLVAVYEQILKSNKLFLIIGISLFLFMILIKIAKFALVSRYYSYQLSFKQASLIQMVGITLATLTPARVGEGSKVILMKKHLGIPVSSSLRIVILERLLDVIFLCAGAFMLSVYIVRDMALLTGLIFLLLVAFLFAFLRFPNAFQGIVPEKYRGYFAVEIKNDRFLFFLICLSTVFIWTLEAGFQWFVLLSFNTHLSLYVVFGIVCVSTIAVFFSALPAGLGSVDLSYLLLYSLVGVPMEVAASTLLIYRFFSIVLPFSSTALILNYYHLSIGDIKREMKG
jgi:uncharacterized membrane protein YbhN (UPF0104 family)